MRIQDFEMQGGFESELNIGFQETTERGRIIDSGLKIESILEEKEVPDYLALEVNYEKGM